MVATPYDNMNGDFSTRLQALVNASGGRVTIVSGYRSVQRQHDLWAAALLKYGNAEEARKWVAPPDSSNHTKGEAADLGGDLQLAHQLAPKFGLHFPMDGTGGKGEEPWHVERVDYASHPGAYTVSQNQPGQEATDNFGMEHVDRMFTALGSIFSGDAPAGTGEADTSAVGEKQNASADEFDGSVVGQQGDVGGDAAQLRQGLTQPTSATGVDAFMAAISGQESGGNYDVKNARTGASGRFQIMPGNWPEWSREAGLGSNAAMTPENQNKVARFKMEQYYNQFGDWGKVAKAWYSGPGNVDRNVKGGGPGEPDSDTYAREVLARMGA